MFKMYRWDDRVDRYYVVQPRNPIERLIEWYLGKTNRQICQHWETYERREDYREYDVDAFKLAEAIADQIYTLRQKGITPTKVIIGPRTYNRLIQDSDPMPLDYALTIRFPHGVPMLYGLELVINPCIDGFAVG